MFDLRRIPILRVLFPFAGGSLAGYKLELSISIWEVLFVTVLGWILLVLLYWWAGKKPAKVQGIFSFMALLLFIATGMATGIKTRPVDPGLPLDGKVIIQGEIIRGPKKRGASWSYDMALDMVCSGDSVFSNHSQLIVYLKSSFDSGEIVDSVMPATGQTWQFYGQLVPVRNSGNPGSPDYKSILSRRNCWYRFYGDPISGIQNSGMKVNHLVITARRKSPAGIRNAVSSHWKGGVDEVSLLKAVCLGDRSELTENLTQAYVAAGGMHLLAVSGLHVGLIWWVLQHAFAWMVRISGKEIFRAATIIALLWFYAFVTGFSSSVCRSVTMFTLFTIGRLINQRIHPVNAILVSAFLLIMIYPPKLLDVGFQLSYSAILGIVVFYPTFRNLVKQKNRFFRWIWDAMMVSLAAQIATLPLVIYYFHQVPLYSLVTSLVAIPILSGLIVIFVSSVPLLFIGVLTEPLNFLLNGMAQLMNHFMERVASLPGAVISDLHLERFNLALLLGMLLLVMVTLNSRSRISRYLLAATISISLVCNAWFRYSILNSSEVIITHFHNSSLVSFREGFQIDHYCWHRDSVSMSYIERYRLMVWSKRKYQNQLFELKDPVPARGRISACLPVEPGIWSLGNDQTRGWVITGSAFAGNMAISRSPYVVSRDQKSVFSDCRNDFVLVSGNPPTRYLPEQLLATPCTLVIDGSNGSWYLPGFSQWIKERNLACRLHHTLLDGAFLKRW